MGNIKVGKTTIKPLTFLPNAGRSRNKSKTKKQLGRAEHPPLKGK